MDTEGQETEQRVIRVARRVYVGNLSWNVRWQDLKDLFSQVGTVKYADVIMDGNRSRGCGIVEFESAEQAAAAIQTMQNYELQGRPIFVREDREDYELKGEGASPPTHKRPRQTSSSGRPGGQGAIAIGRRLWVGNVSPESTWQHVKDHFKQAGQVLHADLLPKGGCAVVEMGSPADALRAISLLSNSTLDGNQITVREDREDPGVKQRGSSAGPPRGAPPPAAEGCQLVLHGLPYRYTWQDIKDMCREAGPVVRADVMSNPDGSSKGFGIVQMATPEAAAAAINILNGRVESGRVITVKYDKFAGGSQ